jgi:hypothetical protein
MEIAGLKNRGVTPQIERSKHDKKNGNDMSDWSED